MNTKTLTGAFLILLVGLIPAVTRVTAQHNRTVTTGASFLLLSPDARNAGVGEAGTGLESDANALYANAAKIVFADRMGISLSYTPWMRQLVDDEHLSYLAAYRRLNDRESLGMSIKYLDLGDASFRDEAGNLLQRYSPAEFALDVSYARKLGEHFAMALTARYIHSALGAGVYNGLETDPANAFAVDVSVYSERELFQSRQFGKRFAWGINLSNVGTKISYTNSKESFLPMNLRLGTGYALYNDPNNRLTLLLDVNKLLVPTSPTYKLDENGQPTTEIAQGKDPNRSVPEALFTSLFDAPGGFSEELSEFTIAGGFEFSYYRQFFLRAGYFHEAPDKGNRQHLSTGLGLRVSDFQLDMSYTMPMAGRYTVRNEFKATLSFNLNN
ncbi:type IX secretion system outer membrane channel protein PorV [Parapedobacter sp. 10938]|uniref:type IX secretion system outer membrane channel protein PorV n=1 Tax=Parapedobacter flavus TaxID=3110225 RepID=UPI002DBCCB53|nr:type IX secretion system outer membrane channel protein PorV [Parapedobacter sp. 10938]MEC3880792.1 type IX secretion system outer membrane channel protein PorV [Parapedobacter sp. 10938]